MGEGFTLLLVFFISISLRCIFLQVVHHGVTNRIREGCLFTPQNFIRQVTLSFKGMAKQILTLVILIQLHFRIDCHNILHKVQITKGHSGFQGVDADTAVSPEHIIHM